MISTAVRGWIILIVLYLLFAIKGRDGVPLLVKPLQFGFALIADSIRAVEGR